MQTKNRQITISNEILTICPGFHFAAIECEVKNTPHNDALWQEIDAFCANFKETVKMEEIKTRPTIFATRQAYKKLGKDPNRYRPSAEALCRRIVKGDRLYQIDTLVDIINLVSIKTGYSIGGFDADTIKGNLVLGVGKTNEPFDAIGRGMLNIEGLPVYRDEIGGIGTPTSDEERTKITADTSRLLLFINGYSGENGLKEAVDYSLELLKKYAGCQQYRIV
jgi:DNA/RNA-binding domain of Phe-tRNA-synthetase-like protein